MTSSLVLTGSLVQPGGTPEKAVITIEKGIIASIDFCVQHKKFSKQEFREGKLSDREKSYPLFHYPEQLILPGLVEQHVHGCLGEDFTEGNEKSNRKIARYLASQGITAFVPTLITGPIEQTGRAIKAIEASLNHWGDSPQIVGIFFEGPFIAFEKKGAHKEQDIMDCSIKTALELLSPVPQQLRKVMLVAPEKPGGIKLIERLTSHGIIVSGGHSAANYETTILAIKAGMTGATHLWNAMAPLHHREPGII
jgi:N-acetylglucosamine-6-phosphate deacetylase